MCHNSECGCGQHARHASGHGFHHQPECDCGQHAGHAPGSGSCHQAGCCCGSGHVLRRFRTREEIAERLEEYLKQLRAEAAGVEEQIAELKKRG